MKLLPTPICGNRELQFYTEGRLENARVEGGLLIIEARREDWQGGAWWGSPIQDF